MSPARPMLIDANVLLRYLLRDEPDLYPQAVAWLEPVRTGESQAVIPEGVLAECVYVLQKVYRVERPVIAGCLRELLGYKGITQPDRETQLTALVLFGSSALSIVDCLLAARAKQEGLALCTFDKALRKAAD